MTEEMIRSLIFNLTLLLTISLIYNLFFFDREKNKKLHDIALGFLSGLMGIILIAINVRFSTGIVFDTRSILVGTIGLFFGPLPTLISAAIISGYHFLASGDGIIMGISVTLVSAGFGIFCNHFYFKKILDKESTAWIYYFIFGLVLHVLMLLCTFTLPADKVFLVFKAITLPVMAFYPLGTMLVCLVVYKGLINKQTERNLIRGRAEYRNLYLENQNRQQLLLSVLNSIPDLIFYKDTSSIYLGCNKAFAEYVGINQEEILGKTDHDFFGPDIADTIRDIDISLMRNKSELRNEIESAYPDGRKVMLETLNSPYYSTDGQILGIIGISRDITERIQKEREVRFLHFYDVLTGVFNRSYIAEEIDRIDAPDKLPLSVIVGDINGLKIINDAFGHEKGDKLLVEIARILKESCREQDIIARTGGDEFRILMPNTDIQTASTIVDTIKVSCEHYATSSEKDVYYTSISLGYATKQSPEESLNKVIKTAEDLMYRKKLLEHKSLHSSMLSSIKSTMYEKSNETEEHAERMAILVRLIGKALGLDEKSIVELELISALHDIGKISIDSNILMKPGPLTDDEWTEIHRHPEIGYRITQSIPELSNISEYILYHHERWDGNGYPEGLKGEEIPLLSRITSVVDAYDAMTQDRSYRKARSHEDAIAELLNNAGTQFDPVVTAAFTEIPMNDMQLSTNHNTRMSN